MCSPDTARRLKNLAHSWIQTCLDAFRSLMQKRPDMSRPTDKRLAVCTNCVGSLLRNRKNPVQSS